MKRAKPKRKNRQVDRRDAYEIIKFTNQLNFAAMLRTLVIENEFDKEQVLLFTESYLAYITEIYDERGSVNKFLRDTYEMTGIDPRTLMDAVMDGGGLNG